MYIYIHVYVYLGISSIVDKSINQHLSIKSNRMVGYRIEIIDIL